MDKATLNISLPRTMRDYIEAQVRAGDYSTPSEYIRFLVRQDQGHKPGKNGQQRLSGPALPNLSVDDWSAIRDLAASRAAQPKRRKK